MCVISRFSHYFSPVCLFPSRFLSSGLFAIFLASASLGAFAQDNPDGPDGAGGKVPKDTEETDPVSITASVSPTSIAAYTGTATLS